LGASSESVTSRMLEDEKGDAVVDGTMIVHLTIAFNGPHLLASRALKKQGYSLPLASP
jgi:hypothetical protein